MIDMLPQKDILEGIVDDLLGFATDEKREKQERFFREDVNFLGCMHGEMRKVAKKYGKIMEKNGFDYGDILGVCDELMDSDTYEEKTVAMAIVENMSDRFKKSDFALFEKWVKNSITNWAHCDHISPKIIGVMVHGYPELMYGVFEWTKSNNRWVRRAAAVTYVKHAREGRFREQIFKTADAMLGDGDYIVQKAVGWLLKEFSNFDEDVVEEFLMKRKHDMSRLVLRYATEKMDKEKRKRILS